jgi:hypothetical protein
LRDATRMLEKLVADRRSGRLEVLPKPICTPVGFEPTPSRRFPTIHLPKSNKQPPAAIHCRSRDPSLFFRGEEDRSDSNGPVKRVRNFLFASLSRPRNSFIGRSIRSDDENSSADPSGCKQRNPTEISPGTIALKKRCLKNSN